MFKKAAVFTDIHLGLKSNSKIHLQDCEEFVDWFIKNAKENNCEIILPIDVVCANNLNEKETQEVLKITEIDEITKNKIITNF